MDSPVKPETKSLASCLASLNESRRKKILSGLTDEQCETLLYDWKFWARPNQLEPPGDWRIWLVMAGRGYGKTRTGAEWVRDRVRSGKARRIAFVAPTPADARDVMLQGESGILNIGHPSERPHFEPTKRRLSWPNGAQATIYSGHEPDQLRGPQNDSAWCDELCSWNYPRETWDMLMFGMRIGDPKVCVTTTPRPIQVIKDLLKSPLATITTGSTYENLENLSEFYKEIIARYEGTTLGEQELHARILEELPGALWTRATLTEHRRSTHPPLRRIVVAIDPAMTSSEESNETGIIAAGVGEDGHGYVLRDLSARLSPDAWAKRSVNLLHELHGDRIIGEVNNGGDMVEFTLRTVDTHVPFKSVHASKGKHTRAEPIAALYEQGKVHHVGTFPDLEDQLATWTDDVDSPDRLDALVWALTELMLGHQTMISGMSLKVGRQPSRWKV